MYTRWHLFLYKVNSERRFPPSQLVTQGSGVGHPAQRRSTALCSVYSMLVINWDRHRLDQLHTASTTVRKAVLEVWFQPLTENDTTTIPMILRRLRGPSGYDQQTFQWESITETHQTYFNPLHCSVCKIRYIGLTDLPFQLLTVTNATRAQFSYSRILNI